LFIGLAGPPVQKQADVVAMVVPIDERAWSNNKARTPFERVPDNGLVEPAVARSVEVF